MKRYIGSVYVDNAKEKTFEQILDQLQQKYKMIETEMVKFALQEMLEQKYKILLPKGSGYLIYRSNKYLFQFDKMHDTLMTLEERENLLKRKAQRKTLDITKLKKSADKIVDVHEVPPAVDTSRVDTYSQLRTIFVKFLSDVYIKDKPAAKAYLVGITQLKPWQQIVLDHLEKVKVGKSNNQEVNTIEQVLAEYQDELYDSTIDQMPIDSLLHIHLNAKTPIELKLKQALTRLGTTIQNYVINPDNKQLYKLKSDRAVECDPDEKLKVKQEYDRIKQNMQAPKPTTKFFTVWDASKYKFKVKEQGNKGAVCTTSPKREFLVAKVQEYLNVEIPNVTGVQKSQLCTVLDIIVRKTPDQFQRACFVLVK